MTRATDERLQMLQYSHIYYQYQQKAAGVIDVEISGHVSIKSRASPAVSRDDHLLASHCNATEWPAIGAHGAPPSTYRKVTIVNQ